MPSLGIALGESERGTPHFIRHLVAAAREHLEADIGFLCEFDGLTKVVREASDGLWNFPYTHRSVPVDALRHGLPMAAQFLSGRMFLPPGTGESSLFVLRLRD